MADVNKGMIITGGSRGIGAATAVAAAAAGYAVCFSCLHDTEAAAAVVTRIQAAGGTARAVQADTTSEAGIDQLFAAGEEMFGTPAAVVANAGISGRMGRLVDVDTADLRRVFDANILGVFLLARKAVRSMSTARGGIGGSIVLLSSRAAALGGAGDWVHYAASKGAVDTLTLGLAREVAAEGIRVNAVRPGLIETEIHARAGAPDRIARVGPSIPMQRAGSPAEVAAAILWLAGDAASYVTGTLLDVGGGR